MLRASRSTLVGAVMRAALVPPAALAVHQLRYLLAFRAGAGAALQSTGHSYLHSLVPWVMCLLGVAAGGFLWALGRALGGRRGATGQTASFAVLWLVCALTLVAIFAGQELVEGLVLVGHPSGLVGVFGHGGWWAVPAAACVGLVLAAVFHGVGGVLDAAATWSRRGARPAVGPRVLPRPGSAIAAGLAPLADGWSDRGPPSRCAAGLALCAAR
jgi:hypothetical protein